LPYQALLCLSCAGLVKALFDDEKMRKNGIASYLETLDDPANGHFKTAVHGGVLDSFEWLFSGGSPLTSRGYGGLSGGMFGRFALACTLPFVPAHMASQAIGEPKSTSVLASATMALCWIGCVASVIVFLATDGVVGKNSDNFIGVIAVMLYACFTFLVARVRGNFREAHKIEGNAADDFCLSVFMFPMVLSQMVEHSNAIPVAAKSL
jgi:hypothetical protein